LHVQQENDSLSAARKGGRCRVERRNMTPMTRLLKQRPALSKCAVEATNDVNEAYLIVHQVMTRAFSRAGEHDFDLSSSLGIALDKRAAQARNASVAA
jgi:hypothetical protein